MSKGVFEAWYRRNIKGCVYIVQKVYIWMDVGNISLVIINSKGPSSLKGREKETLVIKWWAVQSYIRARTNEWAFQY